MQAYQTAITAPTQDVKLVRAVSNMITKDALLIPVSECGTGMATQPYVVAGYNERGFMGFWNSEETWLNK